MKQYTDNGILQCSSCDISPTHPAEGAGTSNTRACNTVVPEKRATLLTPPFPPPQPSLPSSLSPPSLPNLQCSILSFSQLIHITDEEGCV